MRDSHEFSFSFLSPNPAKEWHFQKEITNFIYDSGFSRLSLAPHVLAMKKATWWVDERGPLLRWMNRTPFAILINVGPMNVPLIPLRNVYVCLTHNRRKGINKHVMVVAFIVLHLEGVISDSVMPTGNMIKTIYYFNSCGGKLEFLHKRNSYW